MGNTRCLQNTQNSFYSKPIYLRITLLTQLELILKYTRKYIFDAFMRFRHKVVFTFAKYAFFIVLIL